MSRGLLLYGPGLERPIRLAARASGAIALGLFAPIALQRGIPRSIEEQAWEVTAQVVVLGVVALAYLVSWRWEGVGGALLIVAGVALGVLAAVAYEPSYAVLALLLFLVPGGLFLLSWQRHATVLAIGLLSAVVLATIGFGGVAAQQIYDYYYGPTHPSSPLEARPIDIVEYSWAGAASSTGFTVKARLVDSAEDPVLLVSETPQFASALAVGPAGEAIAPADMVTFAVSGLEPDTEYWYAVQAGGHLETERVGRIRTFPEGEASFTIAVGSCLRTGSNGQVFDRIREALPLLFLVSGDFHYENIATNEPEQFQAALAKNLVSPAQQELYLGTPIAYVWDDHDFGGNGSDSTSASAPAAQGVYRAEVPHYELESGPDGAIYQAFTIGRVRFILTDTRSQRSPASMADGAAKTMLGEEQKAWFEGQLLEATGKYPLIVWVNGVPWIADEAEGADHWGGYATERRELANFIAGNNIQGLAMIVGDAHMLAIDDGTHSNYSDQPGLGFPVLHAAALDRRGAVKGGPYSEGAYPGGGQFALMTVTDNGGSITVAWQGRNWEGADIVSYEFTVPAAGDD